MRGVRSEGFPSLAVPADGKGKAPFPLKCLLLGCRRPGLAEPRGGRSCLPAFLCLSWSVLLLYRAGRILPLLPGDSDHLGKIPPLASTS